MPTITSTEFTNPNVLQTLKNPPTSLIKKKKLEKAYTGLLVCHLKTEEKKDPVQGLWRDQTMSESFQEGTSESSASILSTLQ